MNVFRRIKRHAFADYLKLPGTNLHGDSFF
jgi:hypothetical protein